MTKQQVDRKYKYTKQLVRIAIEHGMTNKDIAKKAGLSDKSVAQVTRWRKGDSLATERQMRFFINEFEGLLKRKIEHLFSFKEEEVIKFFKLSGDIILRYVVKEKVHVDRKSINVGLLRLIIIKHEHTYTLLKQYRKGLDLKNPHYNITSSNIRMLGNSSSEGANWIAYDIVQHVSAFDIIKASDKHAKSFLDGSNLLNKHDQSCSSEIMYIVREQMMKNGFIAEDIFDLKSEVEIIEEPKEAQGELVS
ncbi:hypothetical protein [Shewanella japonica]|uniref:hypothetical protein n=1 Tax=Shewanella japonica TaxID=93973 RepID=UPI000E720C90|nr:hypothetical protein [Shewanella japonica]